MSDEEISRSYRLAKDQKKQIGILADINGASTDEIKSILERCGQMRKKTEKKGLISKTDFEELEAKTKRKYTRRPKTVEMKDEDGSSPEGDITETADNGSRLPKAVKEALKNEISVLSADIAALMVNVERLKADREEIEAFLSKCEENL